MNCRKIACSALGLVLLAFPLFTPNAFAQTHDCYTIGANGAMVYDPTCSGGVVYPLVATPGKQLTFLNSLTLSGIDNQRLDFSQLGQGTVTFGSAAKADASAFQPAGAAVGLSSTALDSLTIPSSFPATLTFHTATGLAYAPNMVLTAYYSSNLNVFVQGIIPTSGYNSSTGVLQLTIPSSANVGGSGTYSSWTISISGPQGATGAAGPAGVPIGSGVEWYSSTIPTGWLWQDGSCISQTTYANLYAVIGNTYNTEAGCTGVSDFGLPDSRGRVSIGRGQGQTHEGGGTGTNYALGGYGGAETHTQTAGEVGSHTHSAATTTSTNVSVYDPGHAHSVGPFQLNAVSGTNGMVPTTNSAAIGGPWANSYPAYTGISASASSSSSTTVSANAAPTPMTIMNPYYVATKIIRYQ